MDVKVVLLGDSNVGKTCVATRFISNQFSLTLPATLSASFMRKRVSGQMLQMWDTAGQEKYRAVSPLYY